ncbi:MAG TPA: SUMF1/EgtB/PvdO family nonheme iron enzyme, partial [Planctomycetaceae bacterium]|nr:SUMF1/EgtB/PvdO family nonheme iron enzyme [Planctomycetaceae bacterium]
SYTQWEFLFAKHYGKDTYFFLADDEFLPTTPLQESADQAQLQQKYIQWLKRQGQHRDYFSTIEKLIRDVLVLNLPTLVVEQEKAVQHKGLRSYGPEDAAYYLDLLPGDRDPVNGLPESVAFWKRAIERTDPLTTFRVGMIYGPSGCGKSSLVKAGILPHLSVDVKHVFLEATPEATEIELLQRIRHAISALPPDLNLVTSLATIKQTPGPKLLLAIDQFEQWLRVHRGESNTELVQALAHCDGTRMQALILVRKEFFLEAQRFLRELNVRINEGQTFTVIDLFPREHARTVLIKFGRSFGKLPTDGKSLSAGQDSFIDNSIDDLSTDERRVAPVRLALFAEMVKSDPWTPETLKRYGGALAIGTRFLEEKFVSPGAPEHCRQHRTAAMEFLKRLIPDTESDEDSENAAIKKLESESTLRKMSPYAAKAEEFDQLKDLLEKDLRLITPTVPLRTGLDDSSPQESSTKETYYQLTHDYLVPSLREWLTRRQKETRKGRAELKLAERSALWKSKREDRHLPSVIEWLNIRTFTASKSWTESQRKVMQRAGRVHGIRATLVAAAVCILLVAGVALTRQADLKKNQAEATRLVEGLLAADTGQVSTSIASLKDFRTWAEPQLKQAFENSPVESAAKLHAGLALIAEGQVVDPSVLGFLRDRLLTVAPAQFAEVRKLLEPHKAVLIPALWQQATDEKQEDARRLHAACALAEFDSSHSNWSDAAFTKFISQQLVAVNAVYIGHYQELLRPIASRLVSALSDIFKDPERGELAKSLATTLLADYAAQDVDSLTELVLAADPVSDKALFPVLQQHQQAAVQKMEAILDRRLQPNWHDAARDPAWTDPSAAVRAKIETAHGLIGERWAFCQDMPWDTFLEIVETLRASGYRPTKVRPHLSLLPLAGGEGGRRPDEGVATAAIWTRDSLKWELQPTVTKDQLPAPDAPATKDGLMLTDLAAFPSADPAAKPQFVALWCEPATADEQRRVVIDVSEAELTAAQTQLTEQGFASQSTITVRTDSDGQRRYTAIISNQGAASELRPAYAGFELVHQPQWDVAVAPAKKLADPLEQFRQQMAQIEVLPAEQVDDPQIREIRATANYRLGNLNAALADLDFLISKEIATTSVLQYRTLTLARLGKADEAKASLEKYLATDAHLSFKWYVQIQVPAWLGEFEPASAQLESAITASGQNADDLYAVACVAALCSQAFAAKDVAQSQQFADQTIELLQQMVANGYKNVQQLKGDAEFVSLHADPRFLALLETMEASAKYAALWRADVEFESKLLAAVPMTSVVEQLKPLLEAGWRPFAIAVDPNVLLTLRREDETRANITAERDEHNQVCSIVLHRPLIPDTAKEQLALQQSAAATALLRLNAPGKVWPLLQDQPDPRLRSYLLHRLSQYAVDPATLITQLTQESDVSRRRSLILGLGEFAKAKLLTTDQQTSLTVDLARRYDDDPDSGVHGAAEWTLKQLGADATIAEIRTAFSTGDVIGDRHWYLTKTGQSSHHSPSDASTTGPPSEDEYDNTALTFAILDASDEFLMGSPASQVERIGGPMGTNEIRHRRRIGRRYAIGTHEITVAQFQAFRKQHDFDRTKARELDAPANNINWYDAAAYCNWLSEQEGIPRDQWCYDPDQPFQEGMSLLPDYLQRTGYRLPSEAEWEFACRSGTTTSRYFGETETLLGEYGWYTKTSGDKWMLPVGTLRPNGAGLFDMQGNVLEWCQDSAMLYSTDLAMMGDKEQTGQLDNSDFRVLRGGSFNSLAAYVRSAFRFSNRPDNRSNVNGFRVARTYR